VRELRSAFEVLGVAVAAGLTFWAADGKTAAGTDTNQTMEVSWAAA
jgi:hypothetical protein